MPLKTYSLTTVARAAGYLGIDTPASGSADETVFINLINAVTEQIERYLGYRLKLSTYTEEEYDTQDGDVLLLNNFPVVTFSLLDRRLSNWEEDNWEEVDSKYYHVDLVKGIVYAARGLRFAETRKGYRANYTAGYDFDNTTTFLSDTGAGDIELAAWMLLAMRWQTWRGDLAGIKSESIGDYSITYMGNGISENTNVANLLDSYVRLDTTGPLTPIQL